MQRFRGLALVAAILTFALPARAEDAGIDPADAVQRLRDIFTYGSTDSKTALNAATVTMISDPPGGASAQFGADLAAALDDGNRLRVLPVVGRGSVQNIADILFLQSVDLGIVQADTLDYLEKNGIARGIRKQLTYVAKLYNEEMHVIAPKAIRGLSDLDGKTVSVDLPNGGTFITALAVFERLGIKPKFIYAEQRVALDKLRSGEIDAVIVVQGKPSSIIGDIRDERLHFVPVDFSKPLQEDYLPASLTAKDYPNLISDQEPVDTITVPTVLAAYNWPSDSVRYRKLALFVDSFFSKFPALQNPPFHPKWKEVSLSAPLSDWQRFAYAEQWLDQHGIGPATQRFDDILRQLPAASKSPADAERSDTTDREILFKQFKAWQAEHNLPAERNAQAQVRTRKP